MSDPIEINRGRRIGEDVISKCDRKGFGPFVAMFAAQTILVACCQVMKKDKLAREWNEWLRGALEVLFLPEVTQ